MENKLALAAARSLFELFLDIKMLADDNTGVLVDTFNAFPEIEKYRVAAKIVNFCDTKAEKVKIDVTHQRAFINKPGKHQAVEQTIIKHWGMSEKNKGKPSRPQHWSGLSVADRAKYLGVEYEEIYQEVYSIQSWNIHSPDGHPKSPSCGHLKIPHLAYQ